ncbi:MULTISPECIES: twin-arginine translocation signal domain-containing protein [Roseobacteraceae]|uniref:twin-arginine translocation signal domain-containing protein n=1 Tax=Roseobacteraceae TaxID=2854170 RepID=UPI0013BC044C|nr:MULTISPECIES: twin-arginine translocation signal domain-containing protein [Roseobacteraceae]MCA0994838.1 twin-arginine translocation signal domain-containing protein [Alloyangia pacifica]NDW00491.1 twin-arginine translocation signal domain-containing protein [Salipiger sp. PrR002]NDW56449.1 twin-arginine translocation signal domain-containing protein [Salipiger sp. PrR004]
MKRKDEQASSRRDFLKMASTAAPLAAVAVATTNGTEAEAAEPDLQSNKLQDTAHTRAYYAAARF